MGVLDGKIPPKLPENLLLKTEDTGVTNRRLEIVCTLLETMGEFGNIPQLNRFSAKLRSGQMNIGGRARLEFIDGMQAAGPTQPPQNGMIK